MWLESQEVELKKEINEATILELLIKRIEKLDISMAKRDVEVFIADTSVLDIWSQAFFMDIIKQIQFTPK
jgi:hypothetical protein